MTNEMIADEIKNNDKNELLSVLWEKVKRLLYLKSGKIYRVMKERFSAVGVEESDLKQECYFVFLEALRAYRPPYKFVTFLEFPFRQMVSRLLKSRIDSKYLYSESLESSRFDDGNSIYECIPDEKNDIFLIVDKHTDSDIIRAEVEKLSDKHKTVIKLYYFAEMSDVKISEIFGIRPESVCQMRQRALSALRRSAAIRKLYFHPNNSNRKKQILNTDFYQYQKTSRH